jgi:sugar lactone lactonase YvrE
MARGRGGFIGQDGLNAPDSPTAVSGTAGNTTVSVAFTAPTDVGGSAITGFSVVSNTGATALSGSITASYDSKSFNVSSQAGGAGGVQFKSDGTKMYVTGQTSDKTFQYSLSTPYDVSTASYDSVELNHATQVSNANPYDLFFKTDGTKLYVMFGVNDTVYQYSLSTAWNLATASYDNVNFSVASQESGEPGGLAFSDDGSKMYACGEGQATVFQYTLSTPWNLSTASYASKSFSVSSQDTKPAGLAFAKNGQLMLVVGEAQVKVFLYVLTTPFDVSTATYTSSSFSVSSQDPRPWYVALANNNTKMYVGGPNNDTVYQYTVDFSVGYPTSSPVTITGLSNGTSYTFNVWAINAFGYSAPSDASGSVSPFASYGIVAGGDDGFGATNIIEYFSIPSTGNATDWGNLLAAGEAFTGGGNATRAIFTGNSSNVMQYITYATAGNAVDFGDASRAVGYAGGTSSASNTTRMVFVDHSYSSSNNQYGYVTIASTGNATDFGDQIRAKNQLGGMASSSGRGVFSGGRSDSGYFEEIEYITIASTGNGQDFGDLSSARAKLASCSSATRGVIGGGNNSSSRRNELEYVTMASTGNVTDFGDLTSSREDLTAFSSSVRGCWAGGNTGSKVNTVDYITIASTGNAQDFGDLSGVRQQMGSTSNVHGGLQ